MDYSKIYSTKTARTEQTINKKYKIVNYTVLMEKLADSNNTTFTHYFIELENEEQQIAIFEMSMKDVWKSLKNHLKIGSEVKAKGLIHYDENEELIFIDIESLTYNDICITKDEIITKDGRTAIERSLGKYDMKKNEFKIGDKKMIALIIIWIISPLFIKIYVPLFLIIFLVDTIIIMVYASIDNKKYGADADVVLEKAGLEEINQPYLQVTKEDKGVLNKIKYKVTIKDK